MLSALPPHGGGVRRVEHLRHALRTSVSSVFKPVDAIAA